MTRSAFVLGLALLAAGCGPSPSADEKAAEDAQAIAQVEAVQNVDPPVVAILPEPIVFTDLEKSKLLGASCAFRAEGGNDVVAVAMADKAVIKTDGSLRVYAADKGSPSLPLGSWSHYDGREHVIDLQMAGGEGTPSGDETTDWPGRLTIRDPYERVIYSAAGTVQCGA